MNREILFKAKRKDNGEWVEGGYFSEPYTDKKYIIRWNSFGLGFNEFIKVVSGTICQSTGICKDGYRIYENDIITISAYSHSGSKSDTTGIVVYSEGKVCWCLKDLNNNGKIIPMYKCYGNYMTQISYIGNVFDNPELLEVE